MKLSGFKRILTDDIPAEYKQLAEKIAYAINPFAEETINAINGKLSIGDNLNQRYKEVTIELDSNGEPTQSVGFKSELVTRCKGISVENVENITNVNTYPTAAPFVTFSESNGIINIKHITGLQTANRWKIRLLYKGE